MLNLICDFYGFIYKYKKHYEPKLKFVGNIYQKRRGIGTVFLKYNNSEYGLVLRELLTLDKFFLLLQ